MRGWIKALPLGLGLPVVIGAASVRPEDAKTNLASWFRVMGAEHTPAWLDSPGIDGKVIVGAVALAIVYALFVWGLPRFRRLRTRMATSGQEVPAPTPPVSSMIRDQIPDLRISDDPTIIALFEGTERDKLFPLLELGDLSSWGRPMGSGEPPLTKIPGKCWSSHFLVTLPKEDQWTRSQSFLKTKNRQETSYYDVHLNRVQIERIWPSTFLSRPMFEAVSYVANCIGDSDAKECFPKARHEIRQAAYDSIITIRGNRSAELMGGGYSQVQSTIPSEYWEIAEIGLLATDKENENRPPHTFPHQLSNKRYGGRIFLYEKLQVNWREIIKCWSHQ